MPKEHLRSLVKTLYKSRDGAALLLSGGQLEIFEAIVTRSDPFWHVMTHTQYGKPETAGIAALTVVSNYAEKFAIIVRKTRRSRLDRSLALSGMAVYQLRRTHRAAVCRDTHRSRTRCRACTSSWSSVLMGTKRMFSRSTASAMASASR